MTMALHGTHYTSLLTSFTRSKSFGCLKLGVYEPNNWGACRHPSWLEQKCVDILKNQYSYLKYWLSGKQLGACLL